VGEKKAKALTNKLKKINPKIEIKDIDGKLDEKFFDYFKSKDNKPDLIIDCVDNFGSRAIANYYAVRYNIPLVSGGTNHYSGQVAVYAPKKSQCLDCKLLVDKALGRERTSHSCIHAAQPSVIMINEIIGGLMVAEARAVLAPEAYGEPVKKMIKYDSTNPARVGLVGSDAACSCKRGRMKEWLDGILKKAAYEKKIQKT